MHACFDKVKMSSLFNLVIVYLQGLLRNNIKTLDSYHDVKSYL